MTNKVATFVVTVLMAMQSVMAAHAGQDARANPKLGPDEVENQIAQDKQVNPFYDSQLLAPLKAWRDGVAEKTGAVHAAYSVSGAMSAPLGHVSVPPSTKNLRK